VAAAAADDEAAAAAAAAELGVHDVRGKTDVKRVVLRTVCACWL